MAAVCATADGGLVQERSRRSDRDYRAVAMQVAADVGVVPSRVVLWQGSSRRGWLPGRQAAGQPCAAVFGVAAARIRGGSDPRRRVMPGRYMARGKTIHFLLTYDRSERRRLAAVGPSSCMREPRGSWRQVLSEILIA